MKDAEEKDITKENVVKESEGTMVVNADSDVSKKEKKRRNVFVTIWLVLVIIGKVLLALITPINFLIFAYEALCVLSIVSIILIFFWKKLGVKLFVVSSVCLILLNLGTYIDYFICYGQAWAWAWWRFVFPLLSMCALLAVLQIKKNGISCWKQLEDMKKDRLFLWVAIGVLGVLTIGSIVIYAVDNKRNVDSYIESGQINGHAYVDLGLPSGTLWATCNVGANSKEEYGGYFAWGETSTKSVYGNSTYTYTSDATILCENADAAAVNWGDGWRMPSKEDFDELVYNCEWGERVFYGVRGFYFRGPNGKSIFFPAAGYYEYNGELVGNGYDLFCWSSSRDTTSSNRAYKFYAPTYPFPEIKLEDCYYGLSVRPVCTATHK